MTEQAWLELIAKAGTLGTSALYIAILIGGYKQWWVWGHEYQSMKLDRDFWRDTALRVTHLAEKTIRRGGPES